MCIATLIIRPSEWRKNACDPVCRTTVELSAAQSTRELARAYPGKLRQGVLRSWNGDSDNFKSRIFSVGRRNLIAFIATYARRSSMASRAMKSASSRSSPCVTISGSAGTVTLNPPPSLAAQGSKTTA